MSAPAAPDSPAPPPAARRLWRCRRHPERPAAARCPSCGDAYCRECVVEHEGRILCSACLAREVGPSGEEPMLHPTGALRALRMAGGLLALVATLWICLALLREFIEPPARTTTPMILP